jgi:hypothetical protein
VGSHDGVELIPCGGRDSVDSLEVGDGAMADQHGEQGVVGGVLGAGGDAEQEDLAFEGLKDRNRISDAGINLADCLGSRVRIGRAGDVLERMKVNVTIARVLVEWRTRDGTR